MLWPTLLVAIGAGLNLVLATELQRVDRQNTLYNYSPYWHYQFADFSTPQMRAIYDGVKTTICFRDPKNSASAYLYSCIDTQNNYEFANKRIMSFAVSSHLDWLFYDDNKVGQNSGLSLRGTYPAIIAVSAQDAYSLYQDTPPWLKYCEDCVKATLATRDKEIYKSADGTFWASFNDRNFVITSQNMRIWTVHQNLELKVEIHNLFPIKINGTDKWVLIQIVNTNINNRDENQIYYEYYVGSMSHETGFVNDGPPRYFSYGCDDREVFFVNKGDVVDDSQMVVVGVIGFYLKEFLAVVGNLQPVILGTPRTVTFENRGGVFKLIQTPAVNIYAIPQSSYYTELSGRTFSDSVNPLNAIGGTKFSIVTVINMLDSKEVGIKIRMDKTPAATDWVQIGFRVADVYYVDRRNAKLPAGKSVIYTRKYQDQFLAEVPTADHTKIQFTIYADASLLEVFADDGAINFNLIILSKNTNRGMQLFTSRGDATLTSFLIVGYD